MSMLLPQERPATVRAARLVDLHGDRYVDLALTPEGTDGLELVGRVHATDCPTDLAPGERVTVKLVMGVMTAVARAPRP
jgi:hypothetical protein